MVLDVEQGVLAVVTDTTGNARFAERHIYTERHRSAYSNICRRPKETARQSTTFGNWILCLGFLLYPARHKPTLGIKALNAERNARQRRVARQQHPESDGSLTAVEIRSAYVDARQTH